MDKDANPRKFAGIDHLGLEHPQSLTPVADILMSHIASIAYQSKEQSVEEVMKEFPELDWESEDEKIEVDFVEMREGKLHELMKLYGEDKLAQASPEEASKWLEELQVTADEQDTSLWLYLQYDEDLSNSVIKKIMGELKDIEGLWGGKVHVRIIADNFDETEEPVNGISNEERPNVFLGRFYP